MSYVLKIGLLAFFSMLSIFAQANEVTLPHDSAKKFEHSFERILVLHSYDPSYQWTRGFQDGIEKEFSSTTTPVKLSVEYLDTKRINNDEYYQELDRYLNHKYSGYPLDAIIVTDDNAMRFLNSATFISDKSIPVAVVGINDINAKLNNFERSIVLYERDNVIENISLIFKLRPNLENIYYLADRSTTSNLVLDDVRVVLNRLENKSFKFVEIRDKTLLELESFLEKISVNDAVILSHYNTELDENIVYSYGEIAASIGQNSAAPVFTFGEYYIESGIAGGYVNHSETMGREAVKVIRRLLSRSDKKIEDSILQTTLAVFDYDVLVKFNLDISQLPDNAVLRNRPDSFIRDNVQILMIAGIIIICLFLVIITQFSMLRQKRELAKKNSKILSLQKRTVGVQKEMIHVLGEAIESRSGETGNHVKRVAMLSALLAKLRGLSHREIEIIEIISPMHDVGKIAVPEAILDKPGKLTAEEWEIMQQHTTAGFNLLKTSNGDLTNLAAIIANEHHERWDGNGYPQQKSGADIHIFARITAIADVFDALLSQRCYKDAWPIERVVAWFEAEQGLQFDPELTALLLENIEDFVKIRDTYPDANSKIVNAA